MSITLGAPTPRPSRSPSPVSFHRGDGPAAVPRAGGLQQLFPAGTSRRGRLTSCLLIAFSIGSVSLFLVGALIGLDALSPSTAEDVSAPTVLRREDAPADPSLTGGLAEVAGVASDGESADAGAGELAPEAMDGAPSSQDGPSPETLKALWMTRQEAGSMLEVMHKDMTYLEYGSGGSTMAFAPMAKRAYSIEHDSKLPSWVLQHTGAGARPLRALLLPGWLCVSGARAVFPVPLLEPRLTPVATTGAASVVLMLLLFVLRASLSPVSPSFSPHTPACRNCRGMVLADAGETGSQWAF